MTTVHSQNTPKFIIPQNLNCMHLPQAKPNFLLPSETECFPCMVTTDLKAPSVPALNCGITLSITPTESSGSAPYTSTLSSMLLVFYYIHLCNNSVENHTGSLRVLDGHRIVLYNLD